MQEAKKSPCASPVVTAGGVKKFYGTQLAAHIPRWSASVGKLHLLIGPNGSGKSSFLAMLAGVFPQTSGNLDYKGIEKRSFFEAGLLRYPELTVSEHLDFMEKGLGIAQNPLEILELKSVADKRVGALSRGWQARLGLALCLASPAQLYLFDEPLEALDKQGKQLFLEQLSIVQKSAICVIATHRPEEYAQFSTASFQLGYQEGSN